MPSPRKLVETSQSGWSDNWGSLGTSSPGGVPELEEEKGPGTLAALGQASVFYGQVWSRGQEDQRGERIDAWGPVCTAAGADWGSPQEPVPFHSRLGNWPSDTTTAAIVDPQELGAPRCPRALFHPELQCPHFSNRDQWDALTRRRCQCLQSAWGHWKALLIFSGSCYQAIHPCCFIPDPLLPHPLPGDLRWHFCSLQRQQRFAGLRGSQERNRGLLQAVPLKKTPTPPASPSLS